VTTNVDVPNGLYNGAWGFLRYMDRPGVSLPEILWIEFTDPSIGQHARSRHFKLLQTHPDIARICITVFRVSRTFQATSRQESTILRWQFPVRPATAGTFHHNQGLTLREGAVNFRGPKRFSKMAGRHYVNYSRFSDPEGHLFVLDSAFDEIYVDPRVHTEMQRLQKFSESSSIYLSVYNNLVCSLL
jgi:hypothetical protein